MAGDAVPPPPQMVTASPASFQAPSDYRGGGRRGACAVTAARLGVLHQPALFFWGGGCGDPRRDGHAVTGTVPRGGGGGEGTAPVWAEGMLQPQSKEHGFEEGGGCPGHSRGVLVYTGGAGGGGGGATCAQTPIPAVHRGGGGGGNKPTPLRVPNGGVPAPNAGGLS